jgi:hypothetical protein
MFNTVNRICSTVTRRLLSALTPADLRVGLPSPDRALRALGEGGCILATRRLTLDKLQQFNPVAGLPPTPVPSPTFRA